MRVKCLHHVRFAIKDLKAQEAWGHDFGLVTHELSDNHLYMRTHGEDVTSYAAYKSEQNGYIGVAFEVEDGSTLDEAISAHGAKEEDVAAIPNAKRAVSLVDPDGHQLLLVHGVERREPDALRDDLLINTPFCQERLGRPQIRPDLGPAKLWRLGHVVLFVENFRASTNWYREKIGIIPSDIYHAPNVPHAHICGFFRMDKGDTYTDHHTLAFFQDAKRRTCHHISFAVQDFEAQQRTHRFLKDKDYESIWGVGRHPHGSHVFDVWRSPDGCRWETFSDTDLFRAGDGNAIHDISQLEGMDVWSSDGPERYFS